MEADERGWEGATAVACFHGRGDEPFHLSYTAAHWRGLGPELCLCVCEHVQLCVFKEDRKSSKAC